jgi:hypothetical protein
MRLRVLLAALLLATAAGCTPDLATLPDAGAPDGRPGVTDVSPPSFDGDDSGGAMGTGT